MILAKHNSGTFEKHYWRLAVKRALKFQAGRRPPRAHNNLRFPFENYSIIFEILYRFSKIITRRRKDTNCKMKSRVLRNLKVRSKYFFIY